MTALLALSACGHVTIKDEEFCADMGSQGGTCAFLLSTPTRDIPKNIWDDYRYGQICMTAGANGTPNVFGDLKAEIEELCSVCNCCDYPTTQKIQNFFLVIDQLKQKSRMNKGATP